jgi:hypothetical protein
MITAVRFSVKVSINKTRVVANWIGSVWSTFDDWVDIM